MRMVRVSPVSCPIVGWCFLVHLARLVPYRKHVPLTDRSCTCLLLCRTTHSFTPSIQALPNRLLLTSTPLRTHTPSFSSLPSLPFSLSPSSPSYLLPHAGHRSQDQPSAQDNCHFMESSSPACDPAATSPGPWPNPQQPHECK